MKKFPRVLIGEIFKHCPLEIFKCIRFLRIQPRTLEIMLRPHYIARRDMNALKIRGTESDIQQCVKHKWRAGYFYLCDKFNVHNEHIDRAVELGLNVHGYALTSIEEINKLYLPLEELKKINPSIVYLGHFRIPPENFEYLSKIKPNYENSYIGVTYGTYIYQNRWDLALTCPDKSITINGFLRMPKKCATSYVEFCNKNNLNINVSSSFCSDVQRVKKYHLDLIKNSVINNSKVKTCAGYLGCKGDYFDIEIVDGPISGERKKELPERFTWAYKRNLIKNFEDQFCKSIKYINDRDMKKILLRHSLTQKIYEALINAGRFKILQRLFNLLNSSKPSF